MFPINKTAFLFVVEINLAEIHFKCQNLLNIPLKHPFMVEIITNLNWK